MICLPHGTYPVKGFRIQFGLWMAVLGVLCLDVAPVPAGLTEPGTLTAPPAPRGVLLGPCPDRYLQGTSSRSFFPARLAA